MQFQNAQVDQPLKVFRINLEEPVVLGYRFITIPHLDIKFGQTKVGGFIIAINLNGVLVVCDGFIIDA